MSHEFDFIERVKSRQRPHAAVPTGIGDDAAVLTVAGGTGLVAVDLIAEGRHFCVPPATAELVGRKALAVNLSDIAAMAGRPQAAFAAVLLDRRRGRGFADKLMSGLEQLAAEFDVALAGGDTNTWDGPIIISVTVTGEPTGRGPVLRQGARPGDWILVSGPLGGSLDGGRHLTFQPRVELACRLHEAVELTSMLDVSDGLGRDVRHLTIGQGLGCRLFAEQIPVHSDVPSLPDDERILRALGDGEDFELAFTVSPTDGERLLGDARFDGLVCVGEVVEEPTVSLVLRDGRVAPLEEIGFEHGF